MKKYGRRRRVSRKASKRRGYSYKRRVSRVSRPLKRAIKAISLSTAETKLTTYARGTSNYTNVLPLQPMQDYDYQCFDANMLYCNTGATDNDGLSNAAKTNRVGDEIFLKGFNMRFVVNYKVTSDLKYMGPTLVTIWMIKRRVNSDGSVDAGVSPQLYPSSTGVHPGVNPFNTQGNGDKLIWQKRFLLGLHNQAGAADPTYIQSFQNDSKCFSKFIKLNKRIKYFDTSAATGSFNPVTPRNYTYQMWINCAPAMGTWDSGLAYHRVNVEYCRTMFFKDP